MIYALHGAVGMAADWKPFADYMKQYGERVARVDLWQYLACCPMQISQFGAAFNKEVHSDEAVLLGYSMGGRLALHALLENPQKWKKAVIVSAHLGLQPEERIPRQASDAEWAAKALKGEWEEFLEDWNAQGVLEGSTMPSRCSLRNQREAVARSFMDWSVGVQENLTNRLKEISCPVLWIAGERDEKFADQARVACVHLPESKLVIVPDCGHRVPWEKTEAFNEVLKEFILNC